MAIPPKLGETIWGFTVTQLGTIHMLGAKTAEFFHKASGARLLYIQNDDQELGCSIIYRTPQIDETDTNHILEHLVLSSCQKYSSRDIFFDMDSKSYSTFMNGLTDNTYTSYPLCTQSQDQLIKLMDVFLCCMESPDFLTDKNFFLREGMRFELDAPEGPLTLHGTVLSEDWGHVTDIQENADSITAKALYPGMTTSHLLGKAHLHYKELSYEQVKEAFYRNYRYSNCLIVLYGAVELESMLEFLHKEHLSPNSGYSRCSYYAECQTAEHIWHEDRTPPAGCSSLIGESPAWEGSPVEQAALIDYAIDLSHYSQEELIYWDLFADLLDMDNSPWHKCAREEGLHNGMEAYLDLNLSLPSLKFRLRNGDICQMEAFKRSIISGLLEIRDQGFSNEQYQASLKENRLSDALTREASHLGYHISEEIGRYWSLTGKTDYFQLYESAFKQFSLDNSQSIIKGLAEKALAPKTSALTATLPKPGSAEELERERELYLEEQLSSMSEERRHRLIKETEYFRKWNEKDWGNMDFLISPESLPLPPSPASFAKKEAGHITCFTSPAPVTGVGCYQLYFDLSGIPFKDLPFLSLYQMLLTELDTASYTADQQKTLEQEYLHDCTFDESYPGQEAGSHSRPHMVIFWYGLTEDFPGGLNFLLDMMGNSDYNNSPTIIQVLEKYLPDYDLSKTDNASSLAFSLAEGYIRQESRFRNLLNGQETYYFLRDVLKRLKEEPGFSSEVADKLRRISQAVLGGPHVVFMAAASEEALADIEQQGISRLERLKTEFQQPAPPPLAPAFPPQKQRLAVCVEATSQETRLLGDFRGNQEFKGRYLPFLLACGDKYLKPSIRYQGGAYDSGTDFYIPAGYFSLWSTADPNIKSTLSIFAEAGAAIRRLSLTQKDLDGYILSAYAQALPPEKILDSRMRYMRRDIAGIDSHQVNLMINDIRLARLEDQPEAARVLQAILENGPVVTVGNERSIYRDRDCFEKIVDYRWASADRLTAQSPFRE